jgi:hypothetical protein
VTCSATTKAKVLSLDQSLAILHDVVHCQQADLQGVEPCKLRGQGFFNEDKPIEYSVAAFHVHTRLLRGAQTGSSAGGGWWAVSPPKRPHTHTTCERSAPRVGRGEGGLCTYFHFAQKEESAELAR